MSNAAAMQNSLRITKLGLQKTTKVLRLSQLQILRVGHFAVHHNLKFSEALRTLLDTGLDAHEVPLDPLQLSVLTTQRKTAAQKAQLDRLHEGNRKGHQAADVAPPASAFVIPTVCPKCNSSEFFRWNDDEGWGDCQFCVVTWDRSDFMEGETMTAGESE